MARIFIGLELPGIVRDHLSLLCGGVPGARWEAHDKLHMTLRFVGDIEGESLRRLGDALDRVHAPALRLELAGVGFFPPRGQPKSLWAGVADARALVELNRRIARALASTDVPPDPRKFAPHVTLARLRDAPDDRVAGFLAQHALFRTAPFELGAFAMFSSVLGPTGSKYRLERRYPLEDDEPDSSC
ncbi:MAG: RNA 2',3'-cyclic phosphodiesterase [Deltaproteobacteria bacterium]|nr:RNA 2',3'-cyclic phosphodiesterase [Nannocystaceae bacterium]